MTSYSESESGYGVRRHTGAIGLLISGEVPEPKTGPEILELANRTEYFEEGRLKIEHEEGGTIEYVSAIHSEPDVEREALIQGLLVGKFEISGAPPAGLRPLEPGVYHVYVNFIEGPDFQEGRWVARFVNSAGSVGCLVQGVEVKEHVRFHDPREDHSRPTITRHRLATDEVLAKLLDTAETSADEKDWVEYESWSKLGVGCKNTKICIPEK